MSRVLTVVCCATLLLAQSARAEDPVAAPAGQLVPQPALESSAVHAGLSAEAMKALMHTYYEGERLQIIPFAGTGIGAATVGGVLLTTDSAVAHAAAWPLITVGALEVLAGVIFAVRAGPHSAELDRLLVENPQEFARAERERTYRIRDRNQPVLLIAEAIITVGGGVMAGVGAYRKLDTVEGVGLGLAIQGLALFLLDWAVADRARAYATALSEFIP